MSLQQLGVVFYLCTPLAAQYLSPDAPGRTLQPAEVPVAPVVPQRPQTVVPEAMPQVFKQPNDGSFADIAAYAREKNIILTWHIVSGRTMDKRIQVYRFTDEPRVLNDISRGTLVAKLTGDINLYEDIPPMRGVYYYAVFMESIRGLEPASFTPARNSVGPIAFQSSAPAVANRTQTPAMLDGAAVARPNFATQEIDRETIEIDSDQAPPPRDDNRGINSAIRRTYLKGDYRGSVRALKPFLHNSSPRVRAKALFYTGLARYRLEQYDRAAKYFEHPLTRKYYRRNAEFWLERTAENLR